MEKEPVRTVKELLLEKDQQLRDISRLLKDITRNMFDIVVLTDMTGCITFCSESVLQMGYSSHQMIGKNVMDLVHPDDYAYALTELTAMLQNGKGKRIEIRYRAADGSYMWYDFIGNILPGDQTEISGACIFSGRNINDRKRAEESLQQSKDQYMQLNSLFRLMADTMPDMIWAKDLDRKFLFANRAMCKDLLNASDTQEPVGKNDLFFALRERDTHPENPDWHTFGEICVDSDGVTIDHMKEMQFDEFGNVKGKFLFLDVHKAPLLNEKGELIGVVGSARDITKQKLADKLLNDTKQTYLGVFNTLTEAIYILDEAGRFIDVNKGAERMYGYSREELIGQTPYDVAAPGRNNMDEIVASLEAVKETGKPGRFEFWALRKSGEIFPKDVIVSKGKYFGCDVLIATARDITEHKQWEETILNFNHRMTLAADAARFGVWEYDIICNKLVWDDWMLKIYGIGRDEFRGDYNSYLGFIHPDDLERITSEQKEALTDSTEYHSEFRIVKANGETRYIKSGAIILRDAGKRPFRVIGINYDITESKLAEQEIIKEKLRAEESDRLKSAFLANMSHEIRTPMNGILGFAELLKEPGLSGEDQQYYIRIIEKSGTRMLNIINDIIDISKIEAGLMKVELSESNINEQVEFIYTFFKPEVEAKGMHFSCKTALSSAKSILLTDREKLFAILTNLVKNAIKYSDRGSIEFGYEAPDTEGQAYLQFYVKDTGIGIPPDRQEAIFERFMQADIPDNMARQGAGLGLSISKVYVEMLGGKIWVESEVGAGSVFYFTLPVAFPMPATGPAEPGETAALPTL